MVKNPLIHAREWGNDWKLTSGLNDWFKTDNMATEYNKSLTAVSERAILSHC